MNGDEKEEAHRPRPLSAGIWTLFSWLRRSERSSSSESVSSVGSARTAVSFDFLAPGNYSFTNTPIVLTAPLNPPTDTYKKRLQDRNLRRQRDRDVTLHRKYGLFRDQGNGYEGFTLPHLRRTVGNTLDKPSRERRAVSECLQRRAAYVPGKRRAPLPPALVTSASLPRTYKRKRPAPKPPVKNTFKDNNKIEVINNPVRMTSESESKFIPDNELINSNKPQKCDKKNSTSKDTKSRADKNFLKHIFENRKRSSVIETPPVRLLPSISELDKQATEIIENNKLRQKINNDNPNDVINLRKSTALYEGNSWFCTSCLRKYSSSVDSCSFCLPDERHLLKKDGFKISDPRSSIYTQTNINAITANSSRNVDERKVLKEILKEMKDSLPKKSKNTKVNDNLTEIPTLRIGSTVQETYKSSRSQTPSTSEIIHNKNNILSISSLLTETQRSYDQKNNAVQQVSTIFSYLKTPDSQNVTSSFGNKTNVQNSSTKHSPISVHGSASLAEDIARKNNTVNQSSPLSSNKISKNNLQQIIVTEIKDDKNNITNSKKSNDMKNTSTTHYQLPSLSIKKIDGKENNKNNALVAQETLSNVLEGQHYKDTKSSCQTQASSTSVGTNIPTKFDQVLPTSSKMQFLNSANSQVAPSVTEMTEQLNKDGSDTSEDKLLTDAESNLDQSSILKNQNKAITSFKPSKNEKKITDNEAYVVTKETLIKPIEKLIVDVKPEDKLHTPLNISSLLNPPCSSNSIIAKENKSVETYANKYFQNKLPNSSTAVKRIDLNKDESKVNEEVVKKDTPLHTDLKTTYLNNKITDLHIKEITKIRTDVKNVSLKELPSTSGSASSTQKNNYDVEKLDNYDRRRHLINQLERSIANGDEQAAAEAAVKLAKLKLSCSVLSFSSQILGETSSVKDNEKNKLNIKSTSAKHISLEKNLPQELTAETPKNMDTQIQHSEPLVKLIQNEKVIEKNIIDLSNQSKQNFSKDLSSSSSSTEKAASEDMVAINVWIEDKQAARGPIRLTISRRATVAHLRQQAEHSLGLATLLQRWIVGRTLCSDDATPIVSLAGPNFKAPFYLCIVQPDSNDKPVTNEDINEAKLQNTTTRNGEFYTELMELEKQSLVPNVEPFECGVCMEECAAGAGVILRECIHTFCRNCLGDVVQHSQEPAVTCPATGCSGFLQEREIRAIVTPEEYERWLARGLATAECGTRNAFHCRTRDCTGWAFCDPGVRRFPCPVCKNTNCVQCQAIHEGETCEEYQIKLRRAVTAAETSKDDEGTQALLNSLISKGEALECPECKAIITKKWGCDWVKCSACKTEICWVTKGRRWGPGGRGDTSGGCRCGVDGQRCHPACGYCH